MQAGALTGFKGLDRDVLIRLSYRELLRICNVDKRLASYCGDDNFWQDFVRNKFPSVKELPYAITDGANTANGDIYDYPTWRSYTEVIFTNAQVFTVPEDALTDELVIAVEVATEQMLTLQGEHLETLNELAKPYIQNIRRGDIVHFQDFGDEINAGKYIYSGLGIESLHVATENDVGRGILPRRYNLMEFIDPSRWFTDTPKQLQGPPTVWCNFHLGLYTRVSINPKYIIFRRDNTYYTIVPSEEKFPTTNMSLPSFLKTLEQNKKYAYYVDNSETNQPIYDEIRPTLRGFILVVR